MALKTKKTKLQAPVSEDSDSDALEEIANADAKDTLQGLEFKSRTRKIQKKREPSSLFGKALELAKAEAPKADVEKIEIRGAPKMKVELIEEEGRNLKVRVNHKGRPGAGKVVLDFLKQADQETKHLRRKI